MKNEPCYKFCVKSVLLPERFGVSLAPSASGFNTGCLQKFNVWSLLHKKICMSILSIVEVQQKNKKTACQAVTKYLYTKYCVKDL